MQPTTYDTETELSSVNAILASIGQSPITTLNFENPEISFAYNLLMEACADVQNEGWVFNREENYPFTLTHLQTELSFLRTSFAWTSQRTACTALVM